MTKAVCFFLKSYKTFFAPAVVQSYDTDVAKEFVIRGNDALVKCSIPSYVTDFVTVVSWTVLASASDKLEVSRGLMGKSSKNDQILTTDPTTRAMMAVIL